MFTLIYLVISQIIPRLPTHLTRHSKAAIALFLLLSTALKRIQSKQHLDKIIQSISLRFNHVDEAGQEIASSNLSQ
jgi:hypothetical protein